MSTTNISGAPAQASSMVNSKNTVSNKNDGGKKSVDDVLATLRELMPGWTIQPARLIGAKASATSRSTVTFFRVWLMTLRKWKSTRQ